MNGYILWNWTCTQSTFSNEINKLMEAIFFQRFYSKSKQKNKMQLTKRSNKRINWVRIEKNIFLIVKRKTIFWVYASNRFFFFICSEIFYIISKISIHFRPDSRVSGFDNARKTNFDWVKDCSFFFQIHSKRVIH